LFEIYVPFVDVPDAPKTVTRTQRGVSDWSAQRSSACLRRRWDRSKLAEVRFVLRWGGPPRNRPGKGNQGEGSRAPGPGGAIPEPQYKREVPKLREEARKVVGDVDFLEVVRRAAEQAMAELLRNPRLPNS
jgi:hypothetical protein